MARNQRFHDGRSIRSSSKQDSGVGLGGAIIKFMIRGICTGTRKKMRKRPFHPQETKHPPHHQRLNNTGIKVPPVTLEEWIMQSPCLSSIGIVEGDPLIQVSKPVSRRIHPSLGGTLKDSPSKSIEGFSLQESSVKFDEVKRGGDEDSFSFSTSQSGKLKKKVSFKEPEVADVFIMKNSPK